MAASPKATELKKGPQGGDDRGRVSGGDDDGAETTRTRPMIHRMPAAASGNRLLEPVVEAVKALVTPPGPRPRRPVGLE